jgi:hypothetical protein
MPAKGRRIAARQAKLSQKGKKQGKQPKESLTDTLTPQSIKSAPNTRTSDQTQHPIPNPANRQVHEIPARVPTQNRTERPLAYNYIGTEIRRILILSSLAIATVIAMGVFLPVH